MSNTPGRTREINFFEVNDTLRARRSARVRLRAHLERAEASAWRPLIEGYLRGSPALRGVVQLLDARRTPSDDDLHMLEFLADVGTPTIVIATKVDKLRGSERAGRVEALARDAGVDLEQVIPFSAVTGEGRDELAEALVDLVGGRS